MCVCVCDTDGFQFYRSANDVILCPGNENGLLPPNYFSEVREFPSGTYIVNAIILTSFPDSSPASITCGTEGIRFIVMFEVAHTLW